MDLKAILMARADNQCELCASTTGLDVYQVEPAELAVSECQIIVCETCRNGLTTGNLDPEHWKCLEHASQSDYASVLVVSWRVLKVLSVKEKWASELLNSFNFDELTHEWAMAGLES